jgi:hypothetical protein
MTLLTAVHNAVVARWLNNAPLVAALGGPYVFSRDWPPPDPVDPENDPLKRPTTPHKYITVGDKTESDVLILGPSGSSLTLVAHGWTYGFYGDAEVEELAHLMLASLEAEPLTIPGYAGVVVRRELAVVLADPNPEVRHANVRYRISTLKVA